MFHDVQRKFYLGKKLQVHTLNNPLQFTKAAMIGEKSHTFFEMSYSVLFSFYQRGTITILYLGPLLASLILFLRTKEVYFKINLVMFHKEEKEKNKFNM